MNSAFYQIISATTVMYKSLILVLYMLQMLQHLVCISYYTVIITHWDA